MRKLISIFTFSLLFVTITFGQAAVEIPFTVANNGPDVQELILGLDLLATSGIDPALGEIEQPPLPPGAVFDVRFVSRPGQAELGEGTLIDIRNAPLFPFNGTYEHQIYFQPGSGGTEITVSWNLPPEIVAGSVIQDLFGGVLGYDEPFVGTGSITVTNPGLVSGLQIIVVYDNAGPIGPAPIFEIAPLSFDFGNVEIGLPANTTATISNLGDADLVVQAPVAVGDFSVTGPFPITIPELGAPVDVTITFDPATTGFQSGDLEFVHNAAGTPYLFAVSGTGVDAGPTFDVTPASLNFGNVIVGVPQDLIVTVSNLGVTNTLNITSAAIAEAEFTVTPPSATIAPLGSQVFTVTFDPPAGSPYTGTLVFTHDGPGPTTDVPLEGIGIAESGLIFEHEIRYRLEEDFYTDKMQLKALPFKAQALQFRLLTNQVAGDETILTFQSIEKGLDVDDDSWVLDYNVFRGPIQGNGASQDEIVILLYNLEADNGLPTGVDYNDLFRVKYRVADLPALQNDIKSSFLITDAEASTYQGFPVVITPSRDELAIIAQNRVGSWGDVNGDGCIDILDLIKVVDHIVERELLVGEEFTRADIAPWIIGNSAPNPDGVVNVQDLSLIQNIILTGVFPDGTEINSCGPGLHKFNGDADVIVTLYINNEGISVYLDSDVGIRGSQIEFGSVNDPKNMVINTDLGQGYYLHLEQQEMLRTLMYDRLAEQYIDAGENFMADMPFAITNPKDITLEKLVLVDIDNNKVMKIQVEIIYGDATLPLDYILFQNYPNPFNPTTEVRFQIPETGNVTLRIYNMLGQEVRTLFTGVTQRGTYTVQWDGLNNAGSKMSSGSYIYRMTAGDFVQSKKMILLK